MAEAVESTGVVRPLWGPHGESCWGSPAPLFSMEGAQAQEELLS